MLTNFSIYQFPLHFFSRYIPPGPCSLKLELCSHNPLSTKARNVTFKDYLQKGIVMEKKSLVYQ